MCKSFCSQMTTVQKHNNKQKAVKSEGGSGDFTTRNCHLSTQPTYATSRSATMPSSSSSTPNSWKTFVRNLHNAKPLETFVTYFYNTKLLETFVTHLSNIITNTPSDRRRPKCPNIMPPSISTQRGQAAPLLLRVP